MPKRKKQSRPPLKQTALQSLKDSELKSMLRTMIRIRGFEEQAKELFLGNKIKGTAHAYIGEEAVAAGACAVLRPEDIVLSNHRGHGHCIAKGASIDRMIAELLGRVDGYCRGLGGSMHIADMESNIFGANGIVGAGIGLGLGASLSSKLRKSKQVIVVFFGDGASNEGIFHESINMAANWKLPLVLICENNQYGLSTPIAASTAGPGIATRGKAYGVPGAQIDGNDILEVYAAVKKAVDRARKGEGPSLIEAVTYRWGDHSMRTNLPSHRSEEEERYWRSPEQDPIARFEKRLVEEGVISVKDIDQMRNTVNGEMENGVAFAEASEEPGMEILEDAVYSPRPHISEPPEPGPTERNLSYAEALTEALDQEMAGDSSVFVIGEDVGKIGGLFGVTRGLIEKYGPDRLRDTPISEAAIAAAGVGAAMSGMRPVVEVQIFDFVTLMMDMIVNQAAKLKFMLGGTPKVPIVFRGPQGGGLRLAAQHSQSLEAWFAHVPGLVVVAPSSPFDAKGLLVSAIREDNPVIFLEHKQLYFGDPGPVPEAPYAIPIGRAKVKRTGSDVTVVATSSMVQQALRAAQMLVPEGIEAEVIDPRTISPLDEETIVASVKKTNRVVVVHEAWKRGGFGAEVAAMIQEQAFDYLDAPIARVAGLDVPMPYNANLEAEVIPNFEKIADAVRSVCYRG
ncbi:pyruvate dehydrogenase complex E1 component subunit beta [Thermodesulfobacteriota bacterium]